MTETKGFDIDIKVLCHLIYGSYSIPLVSFSSDFLLQSIDGCSNDLERLFLRAAKSRKKEGGATLVNAEIGCFGVIASKEEVLVSGPFINKAIDEAAIDKAIEGCLMSKESKPQLKSMLSAIPRMPLNKFLNYLRMLNFLLNKKEIPLIDFLNEGGKESLIGERHTNEIWKEGGVSHGTYYLEQRILSYVKEGDVDGLASFFKQLSQDQPIQEGKLADDVLRQAKNVFIGFIALVGKSGAIKGNLDIEQTYQLIDLYTQECEKCLTVNQVDELRLNAIMDFTRRVAELAHPEAYSEEVYSALQFIKSHTNYPLGVMDVVENAGKSRSYFLARFKAETGETVAHAILKAKLQEAKLLLRYSDRSLADISNFLCFSSQSHFQNLFKKEFGKTPLTYRKQKRK